MADESKTARKQSAPSDQAQDNRRDVKGDAAPDLQDWEIEHNAEGRKAHPGHGDHFVGNAAETVQAPITNEPVDQTRSHGNRPKHIDDSKLDHN